MDTDHNLLKIKQIEIAQKVITDDMSLYKAQNKDLMLALDIQYKDETAYIAGCLFGYPNEIVAEIIGNYTIKFPYIPAFFSFREGPPLLSFYNHLREKNISQPKVLIVDGHGIAHPLKLGVASWLGVKANICTIGCGKRTLLPYGGVLNNTKGSFLPIDLNNETVGYALRRIEKVNPVFVSPGHLINLDESKQIILDLGGDFKIPDPLRFADQLARNYANNSIPNVSKIIDLGSLN